MHNEQHEHRPCQADRVPPLFALIDTFQDKDM